MSQRREAVRCNIKSGKMSKLTKDMLTEDEKTAYHTITKYLFDNFEIDELAADQIAMMKIQQLFYILPKMQKGEHGDLTVTSEMLRKWANEYKLTPKSKEKDITNITNIAFGIMVERIEKGEVGQPD